MEELDHQLYAINRGIPKPALARLKDIEIWAELAHGYHDEVFGYEGPKIIAAWRTMADQGVYEVGHISIQRSAPRDSLPAETGFGR